MSGIPDESSQSSKELWEVILKAAWQRGYADSPAGLVLFLNEFFQRSRDRIRGKKGLLWACVRGPNRLQKWLLEWLPRDALPLHICLERVDRRKLFEADTPDALKVLWDETLQGEFHLTLKDCSDFPGHFHMAHLRFYRQVMWDLFWMQLRRGLLLSAMLLPLAFALSWALGGTWGEHLAQIWQQVELGAQSLWSVFKGE